MRWCSTAILPNTETRSSSLPFIFRLPFPITFGSCLGTTGWTANFTARFIRTILIFRSPKTPSFGNPCAWALRSEHREKAAEWRVGRPDREDLDIALVVPHCYPQWAAGMIATSTLKAKTFLCMALSPDKCGQRLDHRWAA